MRDAETYERYASEYERIARTMSGEKRQSLLAIATLGASSHEKPYGARNHPSRKVLLVRLYSPS
jgi:hypothetical protein